MEIEIPAAREEAESWVKEHLTDYLVFVSRGEGVVEVQLDQAFRNGFFIHMNEWMKDLKFVATLKEGKPLFGRKKDD
jgi:hypothetical protein